VKVTSPDESSVTHGNLCIKGRFGFGYVGTIRRSKDA
jgi:predicted molibdopterin-dependent oxidoreductase YjgC